MSLHREIGRQLKFVAVALLVLSVFCTGGCHKSPAEQPVTSEFASPPKATQEDTTVIPVPEKKVLSPVVEVGEVEFVLVKGGSYFPGCLEDCEESDSVAIPDLYVGRYEVTQKQFAEFVDATGWVPQKASCWSRPSVDGTSWGLADWRFPHAGDNYPVVCVTSADANDFALWLSKKAGRDVRVPTSHEWEYAARAGGEGILYAWGNEWPPSAGAANIADSAALVLEYQANETSPLSEYTDSFVYSSPVGRFARNRAGLFDLSGNVNEWVSDMCGVRGGSWDNTKTRLQTIYQPKKTKCDGRWTAAGFRVVMVPSDEDLVAESVAASLVDKPIERPVASESSLREAQAPSHGYRGSPGSEVDASDYSKLASIQFDFDGALIEEQGVKFGIFIINSNVLKSPTRRDEVLVGAHLIFPGVPVVLMAQDSMGTPTYYGRKDIVEFLASVPMESIPWQRFSYGR